MNPYRTPGPNNQHRFERREVADAVARGKVTFRGSAIDVAAMIFDACPEVETVLIEPDVVGWASIAVRTVPALEQDDPRLMKAVRDNVLGYVQFMHAR